MNLPVRIFMIRRFGFGSALLVGLSIQAQQPVEFGSAATGGNTTLKTAAIQPPPAKSPVDVFRSLLVMSPIERRDFIAKRPPASQQAVLSKIHEYEALQPEQRELRLRMTELRWYLLPLLSSEVTNRTARLNAVPPQVRELVESRLSEWDKLAPEVQRALLENESTVRFYFELSARTPAQVAQGSTNLVNEGLESGIHKWQALPEAQRQEIVSHFRQFFDLTPAEKTKALGTLSEPERLEIEKTLHTFDSLSPAQRSQCVRSFQKFVSFTPEERRQFLKNAERWERMSPADRQTWRRLVSTLSLMPPLPPNFRIPQAPSPPSPLLGRPNHGAASLVTETN